MRKASTLVIFGALLAVFAGSAHALGFGRIGGSTVLGQPLNFSAVVRVDGDETLGSECVSAEVLSGENRLPAGVVRTSLEPAANPNERLVRVTTSTLLDEPVVTVNLSVGCTSRLSRKFVVFLDPPFINLAQAAEPAPAEPTRGEPVVATPSPAASAAAPAAPSAASAPAAPSVARAAPRPRPRPKALTVNPNAAPAPAPRVRRPTAPGTDIARTAPSGPRLKLEAPAPIPGPRASAAATAPPPSMVAAASAPLSPASSAASSAELEGQSQLIAKERERLRALEENLTRLRQETEATQKTLASLQTRLRGAESERFSNPLVYALAGLCAVLLFAVAAMWRRYRLREAAWWSSPQDDLPVAEPATGDLPPVPTFEAEEHAASAPAAPESRPREPQSAALQPLKTGGHATRFAAAPDTMPAPAPAPAPPELQNAVPRRELSVEELIDLEQQAEFFVVLGQDEAAIDLLMGHLRSTGGSSPLPYLKLLEIYRRRGDREAYVRTRERFNRRFNAYAPDWDSDPKDGRSLEDYPEMIERLQLLWAKPAQVIEVLDAALFRRDQSEDTFDVPAYRELVLLYSVVRDIAEHDGSAAVVDLLLPIDASAEEPAERPADALPSSAMPFVSVTELTAADRRPPTLDLDISAVRAFERPVDLEPPATTLGSGFLGLVDDDHQPGTTNRKP